MSSPIDRKAFEKLRRIAPNQLAARREPHEWRARALPEELGFKLTNRCDLRCTTCYQWNEDGYHHRLPGIDKGRDLPLTVIAKVLEATRQLRSNVFLWGGEPLVYREWDGLVELLAAHERWTSICTNGTLIERRMESLLRISRHLEMSVSIDGFEAEHDAIRGSGSFGRTMAGLRSLVRWKNQGRYHGETTVNCVISDATIPRLHDFVRFLESEAVETVFLSFPWYISGDTATAMDAYVAANLSHIGTSPLASWRSFTFRLEPRWLGQLRTQLARIAETTWRIKLRYNPELDPETELPEFLAGSSKPAQNKTRCLAVRTRMDVFPNGDVVTCKFFPEFAVGNLIEDEVADVWHGTAFDRVRETVATCGLMPVCAKCNLLYTRGA